MKNNTPNLLCLHLFILKDVSKTGAELTQVDKDPHHNATQDSVTGQESGASQVGWKPTQVSPPVAANVFKSILQHTLGLSNAQVQVLAKDGYDSTEIILFPSGFGPV